MNLMDVVIVLLIALSAVVGFQSGLIRSVFSLVGLILGFSIASWNYARVAAQLTPYTHNPALSNVISFCLIALLVMVAVGALGYMLKTVIHAVGLGWLDRITGLFFGVLSGAVLVTVLIVVLAAFYPSTNWLDGSRLTRYFLGSAHISVNVTPDELKQRIVDGLNVLEKDSPAWLRPR
jgi:membrane protein required for colicin V production